MAAKENKGGILRNEQVEQDLKAKGKNEGAYEGSQDTGDKIVRQAGNDVQRQDGRPQEDQQSEEDSV